MLDVMYTYLFHHMAAGVYVLARPK